MTSSAANSRRLNALVGQCGKEEMKVLKIISERVMKAGYVLRALPHRCGICGRFLTLRGGRWVCSQYRYDKGRGEGWHE